MGMRLVMLLHPFTLIILVMPLDTEGNNDRVRGGCRRVGVERRQEWKGDRSRKGGRESGGAGGGAGGQKEEARVSLSKYKPVKSYIVSWRVLGMSTLQSMLPTTVSTEFNFFNFHPLVFLNLPYSLEIMPPLFAG